MGKKMLRWSNDKGTFIGWEKSGRGLALDVRVVDHVVVERYGSCGGVGYAMWGTGDGQREVNVFKSNKFI